MARPFTRHSGVAAPLLIDNIDTDQIIPSREMRTVSREGLAAGLFAGWRYQSAGGREKRPDFILNDPAYAGASILLGGDNFGCGSSREHAVWALAEYGFRAVLAPSFGDIFFANCTRNGVLPVVADRAFIERLAQAIAPDPQARPVRVDLAAQTVTLDGDGGLEAGFAIDPFQKRLLLEGLDPIGLTLKEEGRIAAFLDADRRARPWVYPG